MAARNDKEQHIRGRRGRQLIVLLDHADRRALRRVQTRLKLSLSDTVRTLIRQRDARLRTHQNEATAN